MVLKNTGKFIDSSKNKMNSEIIFIFHSNPKTH